MGCTSSRPLRPEPIAVGASPQATTDAMVETVNSVTETASVSAMESWEPPSAVASPALPPFPAPRRADVCFVGPHTAVDCAPALARLRMLGLVCSFDAGKPALVRTAVSPEAFDPWAHQELWAERDYPRHLSECAVVSEAAAAAAEGVNVAALEARAAQHGVVVVAREPRVALTQLARQLGNGAVAYFCRPGEWAADVVWGVAQQLRGAGVDKIALCSADVLGFSLAHLLEALVLRPAREVDWPGGALVVIIDAVDACVDGDALRAALGSVALSNRPPWLRFVASWRSAKGAGGGVPEPMGDAAPQSWSEFGDVQAAVARAVARSGREGVHRLARACAQPQTANLLDLAAAALARHPRELAAQALGRLPAAHPLAVGALEHAAWAPCPGRSGLKRATRERVVRLHGARGAFADTTLVVVSAEKRARVVQAATGLEVRALEGHLNKIVAVAACWPWAITCGGSLVLRHDLRDGGRIALEGHAATCCAVHGGAAVTGARDGTAAVWNAASGARLRTLAHGGAVTCVALSPLGALVTCAQGRATLWAGAKIELGEAAAAVCGSSDGRVVTAGARGAVLWDAEGRRLRALAANVEAASASGEVVLLSLHGGVLLATDWALTPLREHAGTHGAVGPDALALRVQAGELEVFSLTDDDDDDGGVGGDCHAKDVTAMAVCGALACTVAFDRCVRTWSLDTGAMLAERGGMGRLKAVAVDEHRVLVGDLEGRLTLLARSLDAVLAQWQSRSVYHVALSWPRACSLHSDIGHACNTLRLWDCGGGGAPVLEGERAVEAPVVALELRGSVAHWEDVNGEMWAVDVASGAPVEPAEVARPALRHLTADGEGLLLDCEARRAGGTVYGVAHRGFFAWQERGGR